MSRVVPSLTMTVTAPRRRAMRARLSNLLTAITALLNGLGV